MTVTPAVRGVPRSTVEAALTLGAQTDEVLRRGVLNHSIPLVLTGARISFAVAMIVIIAAEMVAADAGLGYMILTAQQMFRTLADRGINIQVISTSEIKISVLIASDYTELALRALHTAYGLDGA